METVRDIVFVLTSFTLVMFAVLGSIDGFYLYVWRFKLYLHQASRFEHLTHTLRAVFFPFILYFIFMHNYAGFWLWVGCVFVLLDIIVTTIDAFSEKDSRTFMGGLPRWEYILHLFANGFHFAALALILAAKPLAYWSGAVGQTFEYPRYLVAISQNLLPGGLIVALAHLLLLNKRFIRHWQAFQSKLSCCPGESFA
jgi:hypothetical protein